MSPNQRPPQTQDLDPDQYDSPSAEEIIGGALLEMMEEAGDSDPLALRPPRKSSQSDQTEPSPQFPSWFLRLSGHI